MPIFDDLPNLTCPLPANHSRESIPTGAAGTAATIARMQDLVTQGKRDFRIRALAGKIINGGIDGVPGAEDKDYYGYARSLFLFCQRKIKYSFDPVSVELIEAPWKIIEAGVADCDSIVVLLAALSESLGLPAQFVTIKADTSNPDEFSHVYLRIKVLHKGWIPADATMKQFPFGWEPKGFALKTWPASKDPPEEHEGDQMTGLACACRKKKGMQRMANMPLQMGRLGSLGDDADPGVVEILQNIWDGTTRDELHSANQALNDYVQLINKVSAANNARGTSDPMYQETAAWVKNARLDESAQRQKVIAAVGQHNFIAGELNRLGASIPMAGMSGLGRMGIAPAILAAAVIASIAAAAWTLQGLLSEVRTWRNGDNIDRAKELISQGVPAQIVADIVNKAQDVQGDTSFGGQISKVMGSTSTILIIGLIGFGAYMLFGNLKKRGAI